MGDQWVEVRSCTYMHEALFLQSAFEVEGIEAVMPNQHTIGVNPLWTNLLGGVRVMVRREDLVRATEWLDTAATAPEAPAPA